MHPADRLDFSEGSNRSIRTPITHQQLRGFHRCSLCTALDQAISRFSEEEAVSVEELSGEGLQMRLLSSGGSWRRLASSSSASLQQQLQRPTVLHQVISTTIPLILLDVPLQFLCSSSLFFSLDYQFDFINIYPLSVRIHPTHFARSCFF